MRLEPGQRRLVLENLLDESQRAGLVVPPHLQDEWNLGAVQRVADLVSILDDDTEAAAAEAAAEIAEGTGAPG